MGILNDKLKKAKRKNPKNNIESKDELIQNLTQTIEDKHEEINDLKEEFIKKKARIRQLETDFGQLKNELQQSLNLEKAKNVSYESRIAELKQDADEQISKLKKEIRVRDN